VNLLVANAINVIILYIYCYIIYYKEKQTLIDASKEVGLEINVEKTKHMLMYRHRNACQNRYKN
jgi:hypothetical protein